MGRSAPHFARSSGSAAPQHAHCGEIEGRIIARGGDSGTQPKCCGNFPREEKKCGTSYRLQGRLDQSLDAVGARTFTDGVRH